MIGIYDYDFTSKTRGLSPPCLDAMKFYTYLLKNEPEQSIILDSNLGNLKNYDKVLFFSDKILEELPKEIFRADNVEIYGRYLENVPKIIEHQIPNIRLYHSFIQDKMNKMEITPARALSFLDSAYYKAIGNEGERLPLPILEKRQKLYMYDIDFLSNTDCWDIFDRLENKNPTSIIMVHNLECHTINQFLKVRKEYDKISRQNNVILDFFVPLDQFEEYFGRYKMKLLGEITKSSNVKIYLGKNYVNNFYSKQFYVGNIFYCLNYIFSYFSRNIPIKAEIHETIDAISPYKNTYVAIKQWTNSAEPDVPLELYFKSKKNCAEKDELISQYPQFALFFQQSKESLIKTRGVWRIP